MWRGFLFLVGASLMTMAADQRVHKVLTSISQGIHEDRFHLSGGEVGSTQKSNWGLHKWTLRGGKQEGVDVIEINNGKLRVILVPTRGMSVLRAQMGNMRLQWISPVKEVVHPSFINLESRGGLGWLEGFNEMMVRCGLEFAGHPGKDKFINNVGDEAEMDLTLHGKIGNIPASEVELIREENGRIRVRGRVDERMFYGPKLELWTELWTDPDSNTFTIEDTLKNHSAFEQEFQIIYHANYGRPLLQEGAKFIGAVERVAPFNEHAAKSVADYASYVAPTKGFVEQVYCLFPKSDASGLTQIMLQNAAADQAISMQFSTKELPYVTLWKNTNADEEGYVTGLEPGTGFPYNRNLERKSGRVPKLKPGETRKFTLQFTLHDSKESIGSVRSEIEKLQGGNQPQLDKEPTARAK